ncbi:hypothetical protein ACL00U_07510 [Curtobacterium poinsettiae]|jgi:hypothetical protein|uniref:hypothetical protein n=1 Tax=Curtobacterium poinsettiae TaxID=159612 RepID=UPI0039A3E323
MTTPAGASSGNGYWRGQIWATALLGVGMVACSVVLFLADPDEPGRGLLTAFGGLLFLTTFGWAVDAATRSDPRQRALFAWAVAQHEAAGHGNDVLALADAARARDGALDAERIRALQALRPDNPYPGGPLDDGADSVGGEPDDAGANRLGIALLALFFALTGLYCSCWPSVFVLGWPFQFIASILAVVAIVRPGRGRRLGVVAAIVSVLGTLVTVGALVWGVVEGVGS